MAEFFTEELLQGFQNYKIWLEEMDSASLTPADDFILEFLKSFQNAEGHKSVAVGVYERCVITQAKTMSLSQMFRHPHNYDDVKPYVLEISYSFCVEARVRGSSSVFPAFHELDLSAVEDSKDGKKLRVYRESMPLEVVERVTRDLLSNEQFKTFFQEAPKLTQHLETIKTLKAEVISLENTLKAQKTEFNFVGLNQGFENVRNKKLDELKPVNRFSWFLIFLILALPIGLGICFALPPVKGLEAHLLTAAPVFGLELLALYFYRVNLQHMRSIKAQIVQLELRQALCQFIQSYAEYSKEIKENNGAALDKFENLIFSGLAVNENQVPTTFDGLETLTNLIKSLQK